MFSIRTLKPHVDTLSAPVKPCSKLQ